ncbi:MAG: nucleotide exchange factor GrpE [Desulfarculaceae bacterium]|nr:nucleotide exchange factor GrpE [Desulfarculaceae bacterium]
MDGFRKFLGTTARFLDNRLWLPLLCFLNSFTAKRIQGRKGAAGDEADWKARALKDFELWISDMDHGMADPEDPPTLGKMDLFTLLSEFAALRKEIGLQNREQARNSKALKDFNTFAEQAGDILAQLDRKIQTIDSMATQAEQKAQESVSANFFEVRDSLKRGLESGKTIKKGMIPVAGFKKLDHVIKGYEIALGKFDKALAMTGTYPVETGNARFDPKTMQAVDKRRVKGVASGYVAEEISCGFVGKSGVIKPAEVIVAE